MSQTELLYQLQQVDLRIARTQKRLGEIAAALADNQVVLEAEQAVAAAQQTLTPLQTRARNLELEIQSNAEKIRLTDAQLYSGRVRNPKELQEMQQEIQSLQKRNAELEDTLLETMLQVEDAETALQRHHTRLKQVIGEWENDHRQLIDERARLEAEQQRLKPQREQALAPVSSESLKMYNALRPRKNNQPMALLDGDSCSVCRVEQDMAVIGEVRRGQKLVPCSSCGRILVYRHS